MQFYTQGHPIMAIRPFHKDAEKGAAYPAEDVIIFSAVGILNIDVKGAWTA